MNLTTHKNTKKTPALFAAVLSGAVLLGTTLFTGCQDPIFYEIRQEVKLEKATIHGDIYSIVRFGDDLYIANGNIYSKNKNGVEHGQWTKRSAPAGHILSLAADDTYIYALVTTSKKNDNNGEMQLDSRKLYCSQDGSTWTQCNFSMDTTKDRVVILMCTNTVTENHRKAFLNYGGTGKILDGTTVSNHTAANNAYSCASLNGTPVFFTGSAHRAACSNADESKVYYSDNTRLIEKTSSGERQVTSGLRSTIYGIAVMQDSVLTTTNSGSALVDINNGTEIAYSNLSSTLSTLYECYACLAVNPGAPHTGTAVYAGLSVKGTGSNSALFTHEGLWAYYPARGKWNIE